jgi:regulator of RNase E activity RraA
VIDSSVIEELAQFSTPTVLNGLKRLGRRPDQLESMARSAVHCMAPALGVRVGYAVTRKVATRRQGPPRYPERAVATTVYDDILDQPPPRILVVQNVGDHLGPVCIWGELAANINVALGCVAGITNGPVRDLVEMERAGFQTFAAGADVGGGFVETVEMATSVSIGGMTVEPGDLLHTDVHGVVKVPADLAPQLPDAMRAHEAYERRIIEVCRSRDFNREALGSALAGGSSGNR